MKLTAFIRPDEDEYTAICLETDIVSQGKTVQEALDNLAEAVALYLSVMPEQPIRDAHVLNFEIFSKSDEDR
ncbi:MAG: type II toxin-antitoxin system HicB family antitoxin [Ignavibacteria bacterium]|nr:type II toxin-antitoxin system HicB family antitoxin [Ignavibacteria bacterium]